MLSVEDALREPGELADVIGRLRFGPDADPEVPEVGVVLPVEQHVGGAQPAVRDVLSVCERQRRGDLLDDQRRTIRLEPLARASRAARLPPLRYRETT